MQKQDTSYALDIIRRLTSEEMKKFRDLILCDYFAAKSNQPRLLVIFQYFQQGCQHEGWVYSKQELYQQMFPEQAYNALKIEKLLAEFNKVLKSFLVIERIHEEEFIFENQLFKVLLQKGLYDKAQIQINRMQKLVDQHETNPFIASEYAFFTASAAQQMARANNFKNSDLNIPALLGAMDQFYWLTKYDLLIQLELQKKMVDLPETNHLYIEHTDIPFGPNHADFFNLVRHTYAAYRKAIPQINDFYQVYDLLTQQSATLTPDVHYQYSTFLRNLCVFLINQGREDLREFNYNLQKSTVNYFLYKLHGRLPHHFYYSIVYNGCRLKDFEWLESFNNQYKFSIINDTPSQSMYYLAVAMVHFYKKEFDLSLQSLPVEDFPDFDLNNQVKKLEIMNYYELNSELLPYKIDAYKMLVSRYIKKKRHSRVGEMDNNFINLVYQLSTSLDKDKKRAVQLIQRIQSKNLIAERAWLLEKARAIGRLTDAEFEAAKNAVAAP